MTTTIINKPMTLAEAAEANLKTGVLLLCKEALVTAIQDRRLERGHLRVLAAIANFMSSRTAKAWPGRAAVAAVTGMNVKTVSNTLLELRNFRYLLAEREAVEEANNRCLTVYTFGNIDHETIRREITAFVETVRKARSPEQLRGEPEKVPAHGELQSPRPRGQSPPTGNSAASEVPAHGVGKSPPTGDSNSEKELEESIWSEASSDDANTTELPKGKSDYSADFETFWKAYPDTRNNSKQEAFKQWKTLTKTDRATAMGSMAAFARYCRETKDYRCLHAERYLKYRRWEAHAAPVTPPRWWQSADNVRFMTVERWRAGIEKYGRDFWDQDQLGPIPGTPGCVVPMKFMEQLRIAELFDHRGMRRK